MPRDVGRGDVESRIAECVAAANDELLEVTENDDDDIVEWKAKRGDYRYTIDVPEEMDYLKVNFRYSILASVANIITEEDAEHILHAEGVDVGDLEHDPEVIAAEILLDAAPDGIQTSFGNSLVQLMSHPGLSFAFNSTDTGSLTMFELTKNIYPYSEDFRFKEFDGAVQSVVTIGHAAATFTQLSLDVKSALDDHLPEGPIPYFQ